MHSDAKQPLNPGEREHLGKAIRTYGPTKFVKGCQISWTVILTAVVGGPVKLEYRNKIAAYVADCMRP
jgi:hypothetical protein